jgi:LuxR family transcriptional regulator, quorum-sensing system regulator BjaR1
MTDRETHDQLTVDVIANFEAASSKFELAEVLSASIARFGYHSYCITTAGATDRKFVDKCLLVSWPDGWRDHYIERGYQQHDPVAARLRAAVDPFRWSDVAIADGMSREVMSEAARFGMRMGYCIPVHGMNGYQAGISIAGDEVDDDRQACSAIEVIATYAYMRLNRLKTPSRKSLTGREREVVSWIAAGKSAWDTGGILNIAEDTVNKHIKSAMRKLDVHTRAQAVAESIRRGEIAL